MNEWQRRARKKKKPRGSIDLSTAYVPEAVPVPQPQQPLDSQFEDESLVGHFPMVVPEPKTAAVGTAMTVQAPKPEFKVNRTHYHMPNQLMEDPEEYTKGNRKKPEKPRKESDEDSVPQF
eukprot:CAMPEP_0184032690 /NCGR_PEP_ID=MMETSP0955-20130417/3223_1 /TAXON_ID=627963 /ORGANISM="Aplanochytrium sp, Strain PBS07" /LENGTH=119 /DNA_ID=CAMNT_0026318835 /DNA_START=1182 /DNA_END=1541 /DNA_ORIENTATION=-